MRRTRAIRLAVLPALSALLALPLAARADGLIDEVRLGVYDHDASFLGHQKETGADIGLEMLFASPALLEVIWSPRPIVGAMINTAGQTDQAYAGLAWTWDFAHGLLTADDGFYVEFSEAAGWNDGLISAPPSEQQTRKSLGSNILFREDLDLGYRLDPRWSIALSYNHISNADLATRNEGLNDVGLRVGYRF